MGSADLQFKVEVLVGLREVQALAIVLSLKLNDLLRSVVILFALAPLWIHRNEQILVLCVRTNRLLLEIDLTREWLTQVIWLLRPVHRSPGQNIVYEVLTQNLRFIVRHDVHLLRALVHHVHHFLRMGKLILVEQTVQWQLHFLAVVADVCVVFLVADYLRLLNDDLVLGIVELLLSCGWGRNRRLRDRWLTGELARQVLFLELIGVID